MAEATGLVIGAFSLASLFSTCVECMEWVNLGRNYGPDFEVSMAKMTLLKARLNAWGESLHVHESGRELAVLRHRWTQEQETVGKALIGIKDIFQDSHTLEKKYGLQKVLGQDSQIVTATPSSSTQSSSRLQDIERAFRFSAKTRQQETSLWKKTLWAISDRKKFDALISNLQFYIDNLERLSNRLQVLNLQEQLLRMRLEAVTSQPSIELLESAASETDAISDGHRQETTGQGDRAGHRYITTIILERARVINGDIGNNGQHSQYHVYENTRASGDAKVVQGNVSADFAASFFR